MSNSLASSNDGEVLTTVLDRVEQIREVPSCVGRTDL